MQFNYKVIDEKMNVTKGRIEAVDNESAKRIIQSKGWQLMSLEKPKHLESFLNRQFKSRIKYESVATFCSQLAMMIRSGANLVKGLEIIQAQNKDKNLKSVLEKVYREVSQGETLSQSMRNCDGALPDLLINLVAAGEESGSLDSVLTSMAKYYERENFIRKKVSSAAIYPVILTVVLIGLLVFFLNFILPEMQSMLKDSGNQLPMITLMVLNATDFITANGIYILGGVLILVFLLAQLFEQPRYRYYLDSFILSIPLIGRNLKNVIIARFTRSLALFLHSSIPIVPILNSMENIVGNEVSKQSVIRARERIIDGEPLASAFGEESFFDPMVIQMMFIGEETGRLEELMWELADHYDKEVEIGIERMVALIEPIFTVIIGIFAGGVIISIALPMLSMTSTAM